MSFVETLREEVEHEVMVNMKQTKILLGSFK